MSEREGESMSITKELREYVACWYHPRHTRALVDVADRIDERFSRELTAKQDEIDDLMADKAALQAKLAASIPPPADAYGVPWTGNDVGDLFFSDCAGARESSRVLRGISYDWPYEGWWLVDQSGKHYKAARCQHFTSEPPDTIDDMRRTIRRGYTYQEQDMLCAIDRAYACGRRAGAARGGGR